MGSFNPLSNRAFILSIDEHGVVDGVAVELGHDGQVAHILLALEQLLDTLFNARRDFLDNV